MTRDDFFAAVRELADQLAARLYDLVQGESERVRAAALEAATAQLRSSVGANQEVAVTPVPHAEPQAEAEPTTRRRAPRRCSTCRELGHDARRCAQTQSDGAETPTTTTSSSPAPADVAGDLDRDDNTASDETSDEVTDDEDDDEDPREASSPPPTRSDRFARIEAAAHARRAKGA